MGRWARTLCHTAPRVRLPCQTPWVDSRTREFEKNKARKNKRLTAELPLLPVPYERGRALDLLGRSAATKTPQVRVLTLGTAWKDASFTADRGVRGAASEPKLSPFLVGLSLPFPHLPCDSTSFRQGDTPSGPLPWPATGWTDIHRCFVSSSLVWHHVNSQAPPRGGLRRCFGWVPPGAEHRRHPPRPPGGAPS